jgi:hypothetical protein
MRELYPKSWASLDGDAWEVAERLRDDGQQFDLVVCDSWTGDLMHRVLQSTDLWTSLAKRQVLTTYQRRKPYIKPDGWKATILPRTFTVSWLKLVKA